jgi:hypothetical protein
LKQILSYFLGEQTSVLLLTYNSIRKWTDLACASGSSGSFQSYTQKREKSRFFNTKYHRKMNKKYISVTGFGVMIARYGRSDPKTSPKCLPVTQK